MGTNYYLRQNCCAHCGRGSDTLHIGKSSAGWVFALHVDPDDGRANLDDWKRLFNDPTSAIYDEYGANVSVEQMLAVITQRSWPKKDDRTPDFLSRNYAEEGPNNLLRSVVDGRRCLGHGDGTWSHHTGYFS